MSAAFPPTSFSGHLVALRLILLPQELQPDQGRCIGQEISSESLSDPLRRAPGPNIRGSRPPSGRTAPSRAACAPAPWESALRGKWTGAHTYLGGDAPRILGLALVGGGLWVAATRARCSGGSTRPSKAALSWSASAAPSSSRSSATSTLTREPTCDFGRSTCRYAATPITRSVLMTHVRPYWAWSSSAPRW
jgi:hypothetical protein